MSVSVEVVIVEGARRTQEREGLNCILIGRKKITKPF